MRTLERSARLLTLWALLTLATVVLPPGVGGPARAVNGIGFMVLGPALATALLLRAGAGGQVPSARTWPWAAVVVISLSVSLTLLTLTSMALLIVGLYDPAVVVVVVTAVAILLAVATDLSIDPEADRV